MLTGNTLNLRRDVNIEVLIETLQCNPNISCLDLFECKVGDEGVSALVRSGVLKNLKELSLAINNISVEGAKVLANSKDLGNIGRLDLGHNHIGVEGVKVLVRSGVLKNLKKLNLGSNEIGVEGAKVLANSKDLRNIRELNLSYNHMGDKGVEILVRSGVLKNLKKLGLRWNEIGVKGAKALANSEDLDGIEELNLDVNNIGNEGTKALIESRSLESIKELVLSCNNINIEDLAKFQYQRPETMKSRRLELHLGLDQGIYDFLTEIYFQNQSIDEFSADSIKKAIFKTARNDYSGKMVKYVLVQPDKYPFLINSRDEQGHTLSHFYTHSPEMQKFLFENGLIPTKELEIDAELQGVLRDRQSVHARPAVKKINFITKNLVEFTKANKDKLEQVVTSYVKNIPKLLEQYQNDQVKIGLLSLTEGEKRSVMDATLNNNDSVPNDKEFIKTVIEKAEQTLNDKYLRRGQDGRYDQGYPTNELQYDYTKDDAKVTIPQSIGYVKLLVDGLCISLEERKELLVTLAAQNPGLVQKKLSKIRSGLESNSILQEQIISKTEFHKLLNAVDASKVDEKVNKLFKEISGLNIEEVWREQKEFILLKQIYIAATTYGQNSSACIQGTWSQIVDSVSEIDSELMKKYDQHLEKEKKREEQKESITQENITGFVENLADKLIQYAKNNPEFGKDLVDDFVMSIPVDCGKPEKVTSEQQRVLAKINQVFSEHIKEHLPNYDRNIPKKDEYEIVIKTLYEAKALVIVDKLRGSDGQQQILTSDDGKFDQSNAAGSEISVNDQLISITSNNGGKEQVPDQPAEQITFQTDDTELKSEGNQQEPQLEVVQAYNTTVILPSETATSPIPIKACVDHNAVVVSRSVSHPNQDNNVSKQEIQSIINKINSKEIGEIGEWFTSAESNNRKGWYDFMGIFSSLFDLYNDVHNKNGPTIEIQNASSKNNLNDDLTRVSKLRDEENRDVLYIRMRPTESEGVGNHWVVFCFFMDKNGKKNLLFIDTLNPSIGQESQFKKDIDKFSKEQNYKIYVSETKVQNNNDNNSCGLIASEITRLLHDHHQSVKTALLEAETQNQDKTKVQKIGLGSLLPDDQLQQLRNSYSQQGNVNYSKVNGVFHASDIRMAHFVTALVFGEDNINNKLTNNQINVITQDVKQLVEKIRSTFIGNLSNVNLFNDGIQKLCPKQVSNLVEEENSVKKQKWEEFISSDKDILQRAYQDFQSNKLENAKQLMEKVDFSKCYEVEYTQNHFQGELHLLLRYFIQKACEDGNWFSFFEWVLSEQGGKIDLNLNICSDGTALNYACNTKKRNVAELLLKHGSEVNKISGQHNKTPIYFALQKNDYALAFLLFQYGAKIDATPELEQEVIANICNNEQKKYTKATIEVLLKYTSPEQNNEILRCFANGEALTDEDIEVLRLLPVKETDPNSGSPSAMQIATQKNNTRLIGLFNSMQKLRKFANLSNSGNVHLIFSTQEQLVLDHSHSSSFSVDLSSIQEQGSLQANLESNIVSTKHFQQEKLPSYDVDKKIFNSIDHQTSPTKLPKHEESAQQSLALNGSLSDNAAISKNLPGKDILNYNWVFSPTEEHYYSENQSMAIVTHSSLGDGDNRIQDDYTTQKYNSYPSYLCEQSLTLHDVNDHSAQEFPSLPLHLPEPFLNLHNTKLALKLRYELDKRESQRFNHDGVTDSFTSFDTNWSIESDSPTTDSITRKSEELLESAANAQSRKQVTYAYVSFVLSGAFAVGASLTIPYLAICISLAVAALTFLAVGCYCSYKANTALSNVEVDQIKSGVNPVAV